MARELAGAFAARGYDGTPALDARLLVAHVLGIDAGQVPLRDDAAVGADVVEQAMAFAHRRAAGEPVARIVGWKEFHGLRIGLSADTLVPRPDTETLVDAVTAERRQGADAPLTILDLGTGTGAILLALLAALPNATGVGVDASPGALATARANAERLGFSGRVRFVEGDWARGVDGGFDVVVSNPPYITTAEIESLAVEVRNFDPHVSLDGGPDGLAAIRTIVADLGRLLGEGGSGFVEIGAGQAAAVAKIAANHGFSTRMITDLAGIERVAFLSRR
ncbi:peptide chain release factor N(5)-glutamine methyltransferase [soil metagenome]